MTASVYGNMAAGGNDSEGVGGLKDLKVFDIDDIDFYEIGEDLLSFQEDETVQQALHKGIDLKKYGRELEKELRLAETESVLQYVENNGQVLELHKQMQECDLVLGKMQEMLLGFQVDLCGISDEIKHLQDESLSMNIKLKNRRKAEEKLHIFLTNTCIPTDLVNTIIASDVNEIFLESVVNLTKKLKYIKQMNPATDGSSLTLAPSDTYTGKLLLPELERLKTRVIVKVREYFTLQFNYIRKPKTNIQVLQQNSLVKYSLLMQFLYTEAPTVADELRLLYIECIGKTLQNLFKTYTIQLSKLEMLMASKHDLIAVEESSIKSIFTSKVTHKKYDSFSLGNRDGILNQIEDEPILLHVAIAEGVKYPYEAIMRSIIKHISDAATNEFLFILDFFQRDSRDAFNRIFGRTLSLILENIENYLLNCYDIIGILIMIKLTHSQRMIMQRRRIPVLDSFFDRISMLLWPRFKQVLDMNIKSIKTASLKRYDLTPHYISRRYAELVASVLILQVNSSNINSSIGIIGNSTASSASAAAIGDGMNISAGGDSMLINDLHAMRVEMVSLLERLAITIAKSKEKKVFLINNYDQILSVFQERKVSGEQVQVFDDMLMQQRELFAEEEVKTSFPGLIAFVIQTEKSINTSTTGSHTDSSSSSGSSSSSSSSSSGSSVTVGIDEAQVEQLVRDFTTNWKAGIQQMNDNVLAYFANFRNGMEILKQVLTQLLLYYTRFQDIIKKSFVKPPAFTRDIVSTATILMEIKRYSRTF